MTETSKPTRSDFRFLHRLRVRWVEVDMQQIVFNGHYLMYVDTAIAAYWRALALPYHDTMQAMGGDLYVRKATLEYEASARYDDACLLPLRSTAPPWRCASCCFEYASSVSSVSSASSVSSVNSVKHFQVPLWRAKWLQAR